MSNQVEQIRTRVKIEQKLTEGLFEKGDNSYFDGQHNAYDTILDFIDSLPKEDGPKKPYFDKEYIESKIKAFSEAHKGETAEQIEAECRGEEAPLSEEIHSLKEWAQLMAERPDLRAEFDKMCPPQPIQGSIAPEEDLEAEIERWWNERYVKLKKDYKFDSTSGHYIDNEGIIDLARHFAEWGAEHLKR